MWSKESCDGRANLEKVFKSVMGKQTVRIVPLAPSNTEILLELGCEELIVGATNFCGVEGKPKIGGWTTPSIEQIERLNPDLLLGSMYVPEDVREWAERKGVELLVLNPRTLEDILSSIRQMGDVVGKSLKAELLATEVRLKVNEIKRKAREISRHYKPRVYCEEFHSPPMVAGNWVPELVKVAGGIPLGEAGKPGREVKKEEVERFSPDIAVLHWCGFGSNIPRDALMQRGWELDARVKVVHDSHLNRPSHNIVKGLEELHREVLSYLKNFE